MSVFLLNFLRSFSFWSMLMSSIISFVIFFAFSVFCSFGNITRSNNGFLNVIFLFFRRSIDFAVMTALQIPSGSVSCRTAILSVGLMFFMYWSKLCNNVMSIIMARKNKFWVAPLGGVERRVNWRACARQ